ncbi:hypothetical protein AJ87_02715 [Rhizobium yanglingense]|nr:hypothetical protein AJ87_02715 [Rhizobium yanglingense]
MRTLSGNDLLKRLSDRRTGRSNDGECFAKTPGLRGRLISTILSVPVLSSQTVRKRSAREDLFSRIKVQCTRKGSVKSAHFQLGKLDLLKQLQASQIVE